MYLNHHHKEIVLKPLFSEALRPVSNNVCVMEKTWEEGTDYLPLPVACHCCVFDIEDFFREIDPDLCQYACTFRKSGFTSSIAMVGARLSECFRVFKFVAQLIVC